LVSEIGVPPFCKTPERCNEESKKTSVENTVSSFCLSVEESNPKRDMDA
jgi:hypothetical protein